MKEISDAAMAKLQDAKQALHDFLAHCFENMDQTDTWMCEVYAVRVCFVVCFVLIPSAVKPRDRLKRPFFTS
jgi:hypothetical protein